MTSKTDGSTNWTYSWDLENRMVSADNGSGQVDYAYDALGRRVSRDDGTQLTNFTYDGQDVLMDDDSSSGISTYQNGLGIDNKLKVSNPTATSYFLADHLGSTNALTDASGGVTASNSYDSFGNATNTSFSSRYQYTGREFDSFTGLQYNRARWYDPAIGRFISEDPIGLNGGINPFAYVHNNPLGFIDPLGLVQDGPVNYLRDPLDPSHYAVNALSNTVSDLLGLDYVAQWAWTVGDYRCSTEDRLTAGTKLIGLTVLQTAGGSILGRVLRTVSRGLSVAIGRSALTNEQLVQRAAQLAEDTLGGVGKEAGKLKHARAAELVDRYQAIYGDRGLQTETSWLGGSEVPYGTRGSARIDVLDTTNRIAYDYKFYSNPPGLRNGQIQHIVTNGPTWLGDVVEVNP